ncbi:alpha/beta fold hydrolase [Candidatus Uabimicrobium amorphum]|uniref:Oxidoreductase n=1 Tax=Uabimicrobium amorphum TaxID=2596890 RepID=A0A5S9IJP6_UABAM|nr:alpha/beta hydrolase [Candidatus Uabimicrobium amorphum]BBM82780.1 oxidoreductase [Candidatus Uabimicrobium amorphum]
MSVPESISSNFIDIDGVKVHYLSAGSGECVLLIHGWPTCAYLWRNVMLPIAKNYDVIAIDLPAFGLSDKPLNQTYSLKYYESVLEKFLDQLNISQVSLAVHDLGGPVGLKWAVRNPQRIKRLILLNTLVYTSFSWAVALFVMATRVPLLNSWMASPKGIAKAMRFGVENKKNLTPEVLKNYCEPFRDKKAGKALLKTIHDLHGVGEIQRKLANFDVPVRLIYGENDRILPGIAKTMQRVQKDLPQAQLTSIPGCGHFLQEDQPQKIGELIYEFLQNS